MTNKRIATPAARDRRIGHEMLRDALLTLERELILDRLQTGLPGAQTLLVVANERKRQQRLLNDYLRRYES